MPARKSDEGMATPFGLPRNLLVPYVLLYLKNLHAHGYQILQTLTLLGFAAIDPATVYRALRQMEREGLVRSTWETGAAGPARRTYQITESGEAFLSQWAEALGAYQTFLDRFFELYAGGGKPPAQTQPPEAPADDGQQAGRSSRSGGTRPKRSNTGAN